MAKRILTRAEMLYTASEKPWEVVLEGEHGRDIVGAYPNYKEAKKALKTWLKEMRGGKVNPKDPVDTKPISETAKMEDKWALMDLKNAPEDTRWSFRFRHDNTSYAVCLQPVGYIED